MSKDLEAVKVASTVIVVSKDMKALIVQRRADESFANLWTVAGGKFKEGDGDRITYDLYYHPAEHCARRELFEETGIHIWFMPIHYLCSIYAEETNKVVLSFYVIMDKNADEFKMKLNECQDYRWITEEEIKDYDFIPDVGGEIRKVFKIIKEGKQ